jgi:hypothetical protein
MVRTSVRNEAKTDEFKIEALKRSIASLDRTIAEREELGKKLQIDFDLKLQTNSHEQSAMSKQKIDIHHAQLDQLRSQVHMQMSQLEIALEEKTNRENRIQLHLDYQSAVREFEQANASYVRLREEYGSLPAKIQGAFFVQSKALEAKNMAEAALRSAGDAI